MDFNTVSQFVGSIGFPIVVALYLLTYIGPELSKLRDCITKLDIYVRTKLGDQ